MHILFQDTSVSISISIRANHTSRFLGSWLGGGRDPPRYDRYSIDKKEKETSRHNMPRDLQHCPLSRSASFQASERHRLPSPSLAFSTDIHSYFVLFSRSCPYYVCLPSLLSCDISPALPRETRFLPYSFNRLLREPLREKREKRGRNDARVGDRQ